MENADREIQSDGLGVVLRKKQQNETRNEKKQQKTIK
jgi:hypothetical protein